MRRLVVTTLIFALTNPALCAVRGEKSAYVAGTVQAIPEKTQGALDVSGDKALRFTWRGGKWELPYSDVTSLQFGQKVGRRVGATVALGVTTLGLLALPVLFSKKKRHFLTIGFGNDAAIFELSKGVAGNTVRILEARTGKKAESTDEHGSVPTVALREKPPAEPAPTPEPVPVKPEPVPVAEAPKPAPKPAPRPAPKVEESRPADTQVVRLPG